jgi:microtubule-associated protein-like 6
MLLKDEKWSTWTSIYGWSMQGVWPPCSNGEDINSCDRSKDGTVVVTGDDFGKVKLFRYPSSEPGSSSQKYSGHSGFVLGVRFLCDG